MRRSRLIVGDALAALRKLPDGICDVGVTSPPYNKGEKDKGWLVDAVKYKGASDAKPEPEYQDEQVAVLNELFRVMKPGGSFFYNHKIRWVRGEMIHPMAWLPRTDWTIRQEIVWDRQIAANIRGWRFWQVEERIYWLHKPNGTDSKAKIGEELESRHAKLTSVWRFSPERDNPHPAPFPLMLPVRCISAATHDRPGVVIDPYAGSGTTLLAAKLLGHQHIGIELSKHYAAMCRKRLKNSESQRERAGEELARHQISGTFATRKTRGKHVGRLSPSRKAS